MINEKYTCYLVSKSSLQSSLLKQSLEKSLDIVILDVSFTELLQSLSSKKSNKNLNYVIIDLNHLQDDYLSKYLILVDEKNLNTKEILINSESVIIIDDLMRLPNLTGLFYESDTMELMSKGMQKMLDGEFWISRDLATSIITVHRKDKYFTSSVIAELTRREEEIMKLLTLGASNSQIAEQLFVSENTVKTHLHNVFKKNKGKEQIASSDVGKGTAISKGLMMKSKQGKALFYVMCISGLCISANVQAIDDKTPLEESQSNDDSLVEIQGLLIDRTLTRLGKDFYFTFAMKMNSEYGDLEVNLTISEVPTALSGSIITIHHFNRVIYKTALSPGRYQAEQRAEEAMYVTRNYIVKWKAEKQFQDTFDLERSEL